MTVFRTRARYEIPSHLLCYSKKYDLRKYEKKRFIIYYLFHGGRIEENYRRIYKGKGRKRTAVIRIMFSIQIDRVYVIEQCAKRFNEIFHVLQFRSPPIRSSHVH